MLAISAVALPSASGASSMTSSWPSRVIRTRGSAQQLVAGDQAIYGLSVPKDADDATSVSVFRYDIATRRLRRGTALADADAIAMADGRLWVAAGGPEGGPSHLYGLNPRTLAVEGGESLGVTSLFSPYYAQLAAVPSGILWLGVGEDLYGLDPRTGQVDSEIVVGSEIDSLAADPAGRYLYIATQTSTTPLVVQERDARSGALLRQRSVPQAIAGGSVSATSGGVWVSYRTGMAGTSERLDADSLNRTAPPASVSNTIGTTYYQIMGTWVSVSDGVGWVTSISGISCVDPTTSRVRAHETVMLGGPLAVSHTLYATVSSGLAIVHPPERCFT